MSAGFTSDRNADRRRAESAIRICWVAHGLTPRNGPWMPPGDQRLLPCSAVLAVTT
jgi:hypothetical protein